MYVRENNNFDMKPASRGPGPFYLEGSESCPFCEDEDRIPVVINNNLTTEIKKIPMNIFRDDAGLIANQFADLFQNSENDDNALRKIYTNYMYKDASNCSLDVLTKSQQNGDKAGQLPQASDITLPTINNEDILNTLNHPHSNVDPSLVSYFMHLKQQTNKTPLYDIEQELGCNDAETSRRIGIMIHGIIEDYRKKFHINEQKEEIKKSDCTSVGRKALNICRQKDPFLREINLAIFGCNHVTLPKEGTDDYYKLAQEFALFRQTPPSTSDSSSSKNDYSPSKTVVHTQPTTSSMIRSTATADSKVMDFKRPNFEDPAIISEDLHYSIPAHQFQQQQQLQQQQQQQQQQQHQQSQQQPQPTLPNPYQTFDASNFFLTGCANQGNYINPNTACSSNINPYQMPGSFLAYNNLNQKVKPRVAPKLPTPPQVPMFLTPHQYLMQASQAPTYPTTPNYAQALMQPQPNFANLQAAAPFYNASFKETHINTAIIQQHQYQQYNVLAAAAAGNYEMLVYEQMLHQTQKIKTVVARNRMDKRLQAEMAKNASKTNTNMVPAISTQNSATTPGNVRGNESISNGSVALRTLFNQIGSNSGAGSTSTGNKQCPKGLSDPAIISAVDNGECLNLDVDNDKLELLGTEQLDEAHPED